MVYQALTQRPVLCHGRDFDCWVACGWSRALHVGRLRRKIIVMYTPLHNWRARGKVITSTDEENLYRTSRTSVTAHSRGRSNRSPPETFPQKMFRLETESTVNRRDVNTPRALRALLYSYYCCCCCCCCCYYCDCCC